MCDDVYIGHMEETPMFSIEVGSRISPKLVIIAAVAFMVIGVLFYCLAPVVAGYGHIAL